MYVVYKTKITGKIDPFQILSFCGEFILFLVTVSQLKKSILILLFLTHTFVLSFHVLELVFKGKTTLMHSFILEIVRQYL